jgi:hypothetical protein
MQAVTSITTPSAPVPLVSRFAEIYASDVGQDAQQVKLDKLRDLISSNSQEAVKEALRLKKDGETVSPIVASLMSYGMLESSAKNRQSNMRVVFQAYMAGFNLAAATGMDRCIVDARDFLKGKAEAEKQHKQDIANGAIRERYIREQGRTLEALEASDKEIARIAAEQAEAKRLSKVVDAAEKASVAIIVSKDVPGIVLDLIEQYGPEFAAEIATAVLLAVKEMETAKTEERQAA